jgi:hypothetical protein
MMELLQQVLIIGIQAVVVALLRQDHLVVLMVQVQMVVMVVLVPLQVFQVHLHHMLVEVEGILMLVKELKVLEELVAVEVE